MAALDTPILIRFGKPQLATRGVAASLRPRRHATGVLPYPAAIYTLNGSKTTRAFLGPELRKFFERERCIGRVTSAKSQKRRVQLIENLPSNTQNE